MTTMPAPHPLREDLFAGCMDCNLPAAHKVHTTPEAKAVERATTGFRHGDTYDVKVDYHRLNAQSRRVYDAMWTQRWLSLAEIAAITGDPEASVSARLRDLRKPEFGGHNVERRRRAGGSQWEYRLLGAVPPPGHTDEEKIA